MYKTIILSAFAMLAMDYIWLNFIAKSLYTEQLGQFFDMQDGGMRVNYFAACLVYASLLIGIFVFVLPISHSNFDVLIKGAIFGLIVYGVYDFTNLAIIKNWPLQISIIDMLWGGCLCSATSFMAYSLLS